MSCVQVCAALVSPFAVASPKQLWSELERWHLAGHEDDKLGLLCKVLLQNSNVEKQLRQLNLQIYNKQGNVIILKCSLNA